MGRKAQLRKNSLPSLAVPARHRDRRRELASALRRSEPGPVVRRRSPYRSARLTIWRGRGVSPTLGIPYGRGCPGVGGPGGRDRGGGRRCALQISIPMPCGDGDSISPECSSLSCALNAAHPATNPPGILLRIRSSSAPSSPYNRDQMQLSSGTQIPDGLLAAIALRNEKPRLGIPSWNPALHQGIDAANSTIVLGLQSTAALNRIGSRSTGKERDTESGLDNFGARYYGSNMGRFMSPDPNNMSALTHPGDPQAWNGYAYARNNPLIYTDPDGESYHICDQNGQNCSDVSDKDFDQIRQDSAKAGENWHGGNITLADGSAGGSYKQTDVDLPGDPVVNQQGLNTLANSAGVVNAVVGTEMQIMAPYAAAAAQCNAANKASCAANMAISLLPEVGSLRASSTMIRAARGLRAAEILERAGGFAQATKDFEALNGAEKTLGNVKIKELSDGSTAVLRNFSGDGRPTLEIQNASGTSKFRYN